MKREGCVLSWFVKRMRPLAATAAEMGLFRANQHSVPGITARYAHVPDFALVAAADKVANLIASALDG